MAKELNSEICPHIKPLEDYVKSTGAQETYRGKAWSDNCRTWVYFDVILDCDALKVRLNLDDCVEMHEHVGTHSGSEKGLVCRVHHDGIIGVHPKFSRDAVEIH